MMRKTTPTSSRTTIFRFIVSVKLQDHKQMYSRFWITDLRGIQRSMMILKTRTQKNDVGVDKVQIFPMIISPGGPMRPKPTKLLRNIKTMMSECEAGLVTKNLSVCRARCRARWLFINTKNPIQYL